LGEGQGLSPVLRLHGDVPLAAEVVAEDLPELPLVLRDQNPISHDASPPLPPGYQRDVYPLCRRRIFLHHTMFPAAAPLPVSVPRRQEKPPTARGHGRLFLLSFGGGAYIRSGASTPSRARPFFRTLRVVS